MILEDSTDPLSIDELRAEAGPDVDSVPFAVPASSARLPSSESRLNIVLDALNRYRAAANVVVFGLILAAMVQAYRTADHSERASSVTVPATVAAGQTPLDSDDRQPAAPSRSTEPSSGRTGPAGRFQATTRPSTTETTAGAIAPDPPGPTTIPSSTASPASTTGPTAEPTPSTEATTTQSVTTTTTTTTTTPPTTSPAVIATSDAIEIREDKDKSIKVLDNDSSSVADLDEETLQIVDPPSHASAYRVHNDHIHYRSVEDFSGTDSLSYRICDASSNCATATLTITVTS